MKNPAILYLPRYGVNFEFMQHVPSLHPEQEHNLLYVCTTRCIPSLPVYGDGHQSEDGDVQAEGHGSRTNLEVLSNDFIHIFTKFSGNFESCVELS